MKLQKIVSHLQKLHPKEIDLSLDRIKKLCKKLGNPQDNLKYISVVGTNGKYSTIQAVRAILKDANINCNIYTSPHIQKINERFIYNDEEISDENLVKLLNEVEGLKIEIFEISIKDSFSTIPPLGLSWEGFVCLLIKLTPSIITLSFFGKAYNTFPSCPR